VDLLLQVNCRVDEVREVTTDDFVVDDNQYGVMPACGRFRRPSGNQQEEFEQPIPVVTLANGQCIDIRCKAIKVRILLLVPPLCTYRLDLGFREWDTSTPSGIRLRE
jgi:hypothetical protein